MRTSFTARLQILLNDVAFIAEHDYESIDVMRVQVDAMSQHLGSGAVITLEAVLLFIEPPRSLDEDSQEVLARLLQEYGMEAEGFFSEAAGSYDRLMHRITPADMGMVFPDGTLRVVWTKAQSKNALEATLHMVVETVELLVKAQNLPCLANDDDDESAIVQNERMDLLRKHGMVLQD